MAGSWVLSITNSKIQTNNKINQLKIVKMALMSVLYIVMFLINGHTKAPVTILKTSNKEKSNLPEIKNGKRKRRKKEKKNISGHRTNR